MRTVKPLRFSVLNRVFENAGQPILSITGMAGFRLAAPRAIQHEVALWKAASRFLGETALDECMPKTRGEVLALGNAYVLGDPKPATTVRVVVGRGDKALVDKELVVVGDRFWHVTGMTAPAPFSELPVTWERAFGGEGFEHNPVGRGLKPVDQDGHRVHPLPNVEQKKHLVKSASDKPAPAGFAPLDVRWPERMKRVGTYDQEWLSTRFPYYPKDFDWEFFNVAPPDQRIDGFFDGKETYRVEGMTPDVRSVEGTLPPLLARFFVVRKSEPDVLVEVGSKIDTLVFLPSAGIGVVVFRGTIPVREDDAEDISHLVAGLDDRAAPRSVEHFHSVKKKREKKGEAHLYLLQDGDLLPPWFEEPDTTEEGWDDMSKHLKFEYLGKARSEGARDHAVVGLKDKLRAHGMSDDAIETSVAPLYAPPPRPVPTKLSELPDILAENTRYLEGVKLDLETKKAEQEAAMRELMASRGQDFDAVRKKNAKDSAGPPKLRVRDQIERVRERVQLGKNAGVDMSDLEAQLADPSFTKDIELADQRQLEVYRRFGHLMPEAPDPLGPEENRQRLAELAARRDAGETLRGFDFTGVDLAGVDLSGQDLSEALFESARFAGASLRGANLSRAMLARAALDGGDLSQTKLVGANLSQSTFRGANLSGADLTDASLFGSRLDGGDLSGATLVGTQLMQAVLGRVNLSGAVVKKVFFVETDLSKSNLSKLATDQVAFVKCKMDDVELSGARLERVALVESKGERVKLDGAHLDRVAWMSESEFPKASFVGARLERACLRSTAFPEADFSGAVADDTDFSGADLSHAKLYHLSAKRSLFVRTNLSHADLKGAVLMYAILQKAKIFGADFRGANLFRADLSKVKGDKATTFKDAYLVQITVAGSEKPEALRDT